MKKVFSCVRPFCVLNIWASLLLQLVALILVYIVSVRNMDHCEF